MNRRCVIFAGLPVAPELCEDIGPQDIIITADAGWKTARALGFSPALALGDFDTAPAPEGPDVLRLPAEKDDTDTFFAARRALETGCSEVLILGGIGGRLTTRLPISVRCCFWSSTACAHGCAAKRRLCACFCQGNMGSPRKRTYMYLCFP